MAFTTTNADGQSQIWLAPLDRRTPPRLIVEAGDQVSFGAPGELIFRSLAKGNALARIKTDGTGFERIPTASFLEKGDVSPDGEWVIIRAPATSGSPRRRSTGRSDAWWRSENNLPRRRGQLHSRLVFGREVLLRRRVNTSTSSTRRTFAIPVPAGKALPDFSVGGITDLKQAAALPGARTIEEGLISPGSDPSTYVFTKKTRSAISFASRCISAVHARQSLGRRARRRWIPSKQFLPTGAPTQRPLSLG